MDMRVAIHDVLVPGSDAGGRTCRPRTSDACPPTSAFTLLEVIIACAIFFMCAFAVLELVLGGVAAAKALQQREPDAGMLATIYAQTNILAEESASGDFEELYPNLYSGYSWVRETTEVASNGLFQVEYAVVRSGGGVNVQGRRSHGVDYAVFQRQGPSETRMSILLFRPGSPPGSASKSFGR